MGRFKKTRKPKALGGSGAVRDAVMSTGMIVFVACIFIVFAALLARSFARDSGYFKLRGVDIRASFLDPRAASFISRDVYNTYRQKNVFGIDLNSIARNIQNRYGDVRDVSVRISLPDRLVISLKLRQPVALVKCGKFYPIDEDGVILPAGSRVDALNDLPVIDGLDIRTWGSRSTRAKANLTLKLLAEIRRTRAMTKIGVASISVYDPRNISFCLKNDVEVRIGDEDFRERLNMLGRTLRDPRLVIENVKYIDVRFKDVIIGPK